MTTFFDFVPSNVAPFEFQPTLDGATYTCVVTWNVFGRRYYVSCYALDGTRIFTLPLLGSPGGLTIEELTWSDGVAKAVLPVGHKYVPGSTIALTIAGAVPDAYNGKRNVLITDDVSFSFALAANPGPTVNAGTASRELNIAGGYFTSTLVYRTANNQFEVSP